MGWQDRDYNTSEANGFFDNPGALLSYSVPFGTWFGVRVRLYFLLLLYAFLGFLTVPKDGSYRWFFAGLGILIGTLLLHEFAHRYAAMRYGLRHDAFILWPFGGMRPPPTPPSPLPTFLIHAAGMAVNLGVFILCYGLIALLQHHFSGAALKPLQFLAGSGGGGSMAGGFVIRILTLIAWANLGLFLINLLPFHMFDGGYLLQAVLWRFTTLHRAINITCIVGMVVACMLAVLGLRPFSLFWLIFCGFLFASAYLRRRALKMGGMHEEDDAIAQSAQWREDVSTSRTRTARAKTAAARASADRALQVKIDKILDKVREQGMQSLTWLERRTLRQATERERQRAGAPRR